MNEPFLIRASIDGAAPSFVGYAGLSKSFYTKSDSVKCFDYGIHPEFRRMGLGLNTLRLLALFQAARTGKSSEDILGEVEDENAASIAVFKKLGARDQQPYYRYLGFDEGFFAEMAKAYAPTTAVTVTPVGTLESGHGSASAEAKHEPTI